MAKLVYLGGWIRTSMLSARFDVSGLCDTCRRASAGPVYHHIETKATRCRDCFEATLPDDWRAVPPRRRRVA